MTLYKGFSSFEMQTNKTFNLNDIELVKSDLINHIFTKIGSRVRMPTFGTRIPNLVFEPIDEDTLSLVEEELRKVFTYDPRVSLVTISIVPDYDNNKVVAGALLYYIELNVTDSFELNIQFSS